MRGKALYPGGWVRTTMLSRRFPVLRPACECCARAHAGPVWLHLSSGRVRCFHCQSEDELYARAGIDRP